jgi:hypothetical protein
MFFELKIPAYASWFLLKGCNWHAGLFAHMYTIKVTSSVQHLWLLY